MTGLIYKATNTKTGKVYVGQTTLPLKKRINGHLSDARTGKTTMYFHRALNRYGSDAFIWEILEDSIAKELLGEKEKYYIAKENSFEKGYNLSLGGDSNAGWKASPETITNMKKAQKGRTFSENTKQLMSKAQKGTKSHKFKPWYILYPNRKLDLYFNTTIKEYAKAKGIPYTTAAYPFKKVPAKGVFKGCIFAYIKDLKWKTILKPSSSLLCWIPIFYS